MDDEESCRQDDIEGFPLSLRVINTKHSLKQLSAHMCALLNALVERDKQLCGNPSLQQATQTIVAMRDEVSHVNNQMTSVEHAIESVQAVGSVGVDALAARLVALEKCTAETETRLLEENKTLKNRISQLEQNDEGSRNSPIIVDETEPYLSPGTHVQGGPEILATPKQVDQPIGVADGGRPEKDATMAFDEFQITPRRSTRNRNSVASLNPDGFGLIRPSTKVDYGRLIQGKDTNGPVQTRRPKTTPPKAATSKAVPQDVAESIEEHQSVEPHYNIVEDNVTSEDCRSPSPEICGSNSIGKKMATSPRSLRGRSHTKESDSSTTMDKITSPESFSQFERAEKSHLATTAKADITYPTLTKLDKQLYMTDYIKYGKDSGISLEEFIQKRKEDFKVPTPRKRFRAVNPKEGAPKEKRRKEAPKQATRAASTSQDILHDITANIIKDSVASELF